MFTSGSWNLSEVEVGNPRLADKQLFICSGVNKYSVHFMWEQNQITFFEISVF